MIYITQLIFVKEGKEETFLEFENFAIPLMEKYNGKVIYRIRPNKDSYIDADHNDLPFEIHFISFNTEQDLQNFMKCDERMEYIHLKEDSVESIILIKGKKL